MENSASDATSHEHGTGAPMAGIGIITMGQQNHVRSDFVYTASDLFKIFMILQDMAVMIFRKPQEIQMRIPESKKLATPALLLLPDRCFCFFGRRSAKSVFHAAGTRGKN